MLVVCDWDDDWHTGDILQSGSVEYGLNTRTQLTQLTRNVSISSREFCMVEKKNKQNIVWTCGGGGVIITSLSQHAWISQVQNSCGWPSPNYTQYTDRHGPFEIYWTRAGRAENEIVSRPTALQSTQQRR